MAVWWPWLWFCWVVKWWPKDWQSRKRVEKRTDNETNVIRWTENLGQGRDEDVNCQQASPSLPLENHVERNGRSWLPNERKETSGGVLNNTETNQLEIKQRKRNTFLFCFLWVRLLGETRRAYQSEGKRRCSDTTGCVDVFDFYSSLLVSVLFILAVVICSLAAWLSLSWRFVSAVGSVPAMINLPTG